MKAFYKRRKIKGRSIDEHRLVMEQHLGRKLTFYEVVHHIDGDKYNNDLSNLELCTRKEHSIIHNQKHPLTKECEVCGAEFTPKPTKRARAKTCSDKCKRELMRRNSSSAKITKNQRDEIIRRFSLGEMGKKLAIEFGITPQAVSYIIHHCPASRLSDI